MARSRKVRPNDTPGVATARAQALAPVPSSGPCRESHRPVDEGKAGVQRPQRENERARRLPWRAVFSLAARIRRITWTRPRERARNRTQARAPHPSLIV